MTPEIRITRKTPGYRFAVVVGGKVVASGHRSTSELARIAAEREAAVYRKMKRAKYER